MADFSYLPEVAWVRILSYLPFGDRWRVSQTCHLLNESFSHPSLWDTVEIILSSEWLQNRPADVHFISPKRHLNMIQNFGCYIKNLSLVYIGYQRTTIPDDCKAVIEELKHRATRIETLILDADIIITERDILSNDVKYSDLDPFIDLVQNAADLKSITIRSWPNYRGLKSGDILGALIQKEKSLGLKKLALYWESARDATWATLNAILPPHDTMTALMKNFSNLVALSLRSSMINEDILKQLSRKDHAPIEKLNILITFSRQEPQKHLPEIQEGTWQMLRDHSPELLVEFTVVTRIPYADLANFMKPNIPVGGLGFMKYARIGKYDLQDISHKYAQTLQKFICLADPEDLDEQIVDMVTKCKNLIYFVHHGFMSYVTVRELAQIRGDKWYKFEVYENNIITQILDPVEDENVIVSRNDEGGLFLVRHQYQEQTMEERTQILGQLCLDVSDYVGYIWGTVGSNSVERVLATRRSNFSGYHYEDLVKVVPTKYLIAKGWPWV